VTGYDFPGPIFRQLPEGEGGKEDGVKVERPKTINFPHKPGARIFARLHLIRAGVVAAIVDRGSSATRRLEKTSSRKRRMRVVDAISAAAGQVRLSKKWR
jgi:hypothetical protein